MGINLKLRGDGCAQSISGGDFFIDQIGMCFNVLGAILRHIAANPWAENARIRFDDLRAVGIEIEPQVLVDFIMGHSIDFEDGEGNSSIGLRLFSGVDWGQDDLVVHGWANRDDLAPFIRGEKTLTGIMQDHVKEMRDYIEDITD